MTNHRKMTGRGTYLIRTNDELIALLIRRKRFLNDQQPQNVRVEEAS